MAITVTSDLTTITASNTTTDGGTFYRLNGVSSGNPVADSDAFVQSSACIAFKTGTTISPTDTGGHFNATANFNATGQHIFVWANITTAGNMPTQGNTGFSIGLTNTSTTSTTAWSTTNFKRWRLDGNDTMPATVGWKCYVIDPTSAAELSAGTLTVSSIRNVGFLLRQTTSVNTALNNIFVDAVRRGTGMTATTSLAGDTITFNNLFAVDATNTNAWGIITQNAGIYYGAAKITIGASNQTNACNFTDSDQVLVWRKYPVAPTLYEFNLVGASGSKTTMTLNSCVVRGQSGQVWNISCDANSDFKANGSAFANLRYASLSSGSVVDGCSFNACGTIDVNGATFSDSTFSTHTANQIKVDSLSELSGLSNLLFEKSGGTGHAIVIGGSAGNAALNNLNFSGYGAQWDGSGGDPYRGSTALALHMDGTNNSTVFTDSSPSPKTITRGGTPLISTAQSKFGGASGFFDGSGDHLLVTNHPELNLGSSDFTIEFWSYVTAKGSSGTAFLGKWGTSATQARSYILAVVTGTPDTLIFNCSSNGDAPTTILSSTTTPALNQWNHIAVTRQGDTFRLFLNGSLLATATQSITLFETDEPLCIAANYENVQTASNGVFDVNGYLDDLRITKGVARYTSAFSVPTAAFPDTGGDTGNAAIFVDIPSGTVNLTVSGGNTPSIRTSGATVNVVSGATVTFTGLPTGTDIVILSAGTNTILQQVDQNPSTSYAWGYSGTPTVDVGFIKPGFVPYYIRGLSLGTTDSSIPVAMSADRNYV